MSVAASRFSLSDEKDAAGEGESDAACRGVRLGLCLLAEAVSVSRIALFSSTEADMFASRAIVHQLRRRRSDREGKKVRRFALMTLGCSSG